MLLPPLFALAAHVAGSALLVEVLGEVARDLLSEAPLLLAAVLAAALVVREFGLLAAAHGDHRGPREASSREGAFFWWREGSPAPWLAATPLGVGDVTGAMSCSPGSLSSLVGRRISFTTRLPPVRSCVSSSAECDSSRRM